MVLAFVLTRVDFSVVEVTGHVPFLWHSFAVEFAFVFISDVIHSADREVHIQTIAIFPFLSRTSSVFLLLGSSTSHEAFVIISLIVVTANFLNDPLTEETLVDRVLITNPFMKFGDPETIGFTLIIISGSISSANGLEVMGTSAPILAEASSCDRSVHTFGDTLILICSLVDSTDRVARIDFKRTHTTLRTGPLVIVVPAFAVLHGLDVGALSSTHISISHAIASTHRKKRIITRTSCVSFSWGEIPVMFIPPPLSDNQLRSCKADRNVCGDRRGSGNT